MDKRTYVLRIFLFVMMMVTGANVWGQPFISTTADDVTNGTEKLYYIESKSATGFFMIPHTDDTKGSTSNMPNERMWWYFMDSGEDNYYYIINKSTGKYLYLSGKLGDNNTIQIADYNNNKADKYKFSFVANGSYWVIYPKDGYPTNENVGYWVSKQGGNIDYYNSGAQRWLKSTNWGSSPDDNSKWNIIAKDAVTWAHPFNDSTDGNKHFYLIRNANPNTNSFYLSTLYNTDKDYAVVSTIDSDSRIWYFVEAASDGNIPNLKYYYLVNASTGNYMYFNNSTTTGTQIQSSAKAFDLRAYSSGENEDRYQYAVVNAIGDGYTGYSIVPKLLIELYDYKYNALGASTMSNDTYLGTLRDRNSNQNSAHWNFEPTEYSTVCVNPTITFSNATGKATITTATTRSTIYYTTDGTEPSSSNGTQYVDPIDVTEQTTIKAIVTRTGFTDSEVVTETIYQVATPTIQDNGSNAISITCDTEGATIYYTTKGNDPTTSDTQYTGPLTENLSGVEIRAIAVKNGLVNSVVGSGTVTMQCAKPVITKGGGNVTITCSFPSTGVSIYYTKNGGEPSSSSTPYSGAISVTNGDVIKAIAVASGYENSPVATKTIHDDLTPTDGKYLINSQTDFETFVDMVSEEVGAGYYYVLKTNVSASSVITQPFTGTLEVEADANGNYYKISGLRHALFNSINGGTVKNVILDDVNISGGTNAGAICNEATGATRIYNCGVLATGENGSSIGGSGHVGSIVGSISGNTRVINCYSFANVNGGTYTAGIVGYNPVGTTQTNIDEAGMVMNCMFYGDITGSNISPVYGGEMIDNAGETGVNNYNYYRRNSYDRETDTYVDDVTFDNSLSLDDYHRSWPADAKYLTRFEYYRNILNSNKKLCTWWVKGTNGTAPTDDDVEEVGIAKWVLDPSIAPYPILKKWGKYPSVINQDPDKRFDPSTKTWVNRVDASANWGKDMAPETKGQELGTISVTINNGRTPSSSKTPEDGFKITAMDTEHDDYCYGKIQLPYYNEIFGNPEGNSWEAKYGGNYTDKVVTGWEISGGSAATDYNFADRSSYKDRIFAQGGYFYVPKGVESITITAHWADAVYLCNKDYSIDRVNVANGEKKADNQRGVPEYGSSFTPAGAISNTFQGQNVYTTIQDAIAQLGTSGSGKDVYNQAIVLIGNVQVRNHSYVVNLTGSNTKPFTLMSADLDFDNEPDNCLELQFRNDIDRPGVQPIRFDFLPVPELGLAMRTNSKAYAIGIMIPLGHFEITETAFMHTTQFEYDANFTRTGKSPVIINGGEHEMFTVRKHASDRTSYFLLGGKAWIHRFAPGAHPNTGDSPAIYLCPINVIGGEIKELYLSGLYRPELPTPRNNQGNSIQGDPSCYIDGGKFDIVAGAGYDKVAGGVTFKIDHSLIDEFYGGGINGSNPIGGNIDVTINNSKVDKYCGGPKVGDMSGRTVTTRAKGTTFGVFYGGGNGGNSYYRQLQRDGDMGSSHIGTWDDTQYNWNGFTPVATTFDDGEGTDADDPNKKRRENKGYHAEYEFEVFNQSNGLSDEITQRGFIHWIQFGITKTGDVKSTLENCKVLNNFYGGGNLATVNGSVESTLTNTEVTGSVFGAGYSAAIPTFQVHDKANKVFPSINDAGIITDGSIPYASTVYEWTNELDGVSGHDADYMKAHPTYSKTVGGVTKWYCYTWNSLANLGKVMGTATLNITGTTTVTGNVYGGGEESDVAGDTRMTISGGTIGNGSSDDAEHGNVFGGGKGSDENFTCDKAMVGVNDDGKCADPALESNKDKGTKVIITDGTVNGNVYGGGEVGRVEWNTQVTIGIKDDDNNSHRPVISGNVFGAGAGLETHGYSALVRGNSTVTVQGKAKVLHNVYGGGENATVGRYWVKGIPTTLCPDDPNETAIPTPPADLPNEMPYQQRRGGICRVTIQDQAQIGPDDGGTETAGHVFGAGKGVTPHFVESGTGQSQKMTSTGLVTFAADATHATAEDAYLEFLQTLALVTNTDVTIDGSAKVKGSVYGGSESGFVQHNTNVVVKGGTIGTTDLGGAYYGNVYGGGKGDAEHTGSNNNYLVAGIVKGWTKVKIEGGTILHNIYGGGAYGTVGVFDYGTNGLPTGLKTTAPENSGKTEIHITGGTIGTTGQENGMIFGSSRGDVGAPGSIHDKLAWVYDTHVAIGDTTNNTTTTETPLIRGSIYGGGENGHNLRNAYVRINGGTIGIQNGDNVVVTNADNTQTTYEPYNYPYRGNVYGGGCGTDKYYEDESGVENPRDGNGDTYNPLAGIVRGTAFVNITAGYVVHNVYGAGAMGSVDTKTKVNISGGRIGYDGTKNGNVYGAARGNYGYTTAASGLAYVRETAVNISYATTPASDNTAKTAQLIAGSVFGGGESGTVQGSVTVNMTGGLILKDLYGGGALADTQTSNWDESANSSAGGWATGKTSASNTTTVRLTGGTVGEEVFGGGLGEAGKPAYVWGDVLVDLNGTTTMDATTGKPTVNGTRTTNTKGCIANEVFGGNNVNGSPKGDVMVHVYATQNKEKKTIAAKFKLDNESLDQESSEGDDAYVERLKEILADKIEMAEALSITVSDANKDLCNNDAATATALKTAVTGVLSAINEKTTDEINGVRYDVKAVYGGGNQAAYIPYAPYTTDNTTGAKTQVIIEGCEETSIETVYGGGNAAAVPETNVEIRSAYEIGYVFGGGNGKDALAPGVENPGADVGQYFNGTTLATYGTGNANTLLEGGLIHEVYGGSNQKGTIKGSINQSTDPDASNCELVMSKVVGAGKYADIDGDVNMVLSCQPSSKIDLLFAGADEANVNGNISLTITNGNFGKVFGGNNLGGAVKGTIVVNVEETGCQPINIDELYLGGNEAAYSIYGYYESNETHAVTGKKILKPRESATDENRPVQHNGSPYESIDGFTNYAQPQLNVISCTHIGKVFGGGYGAGAKMYADPTVNINMIKGTPHGTTSDALGTIGDVYGGGNAANVIGNTTVNIGTETTVTMTSVAADDPSTTDIDEKHPVVLGANITGNVYGGGQLADVGQYDVANDHVDVAGNTYVNIGAKYNTTTEKWESVAEGTSKVLIAGNVFGGGEGEAAESGAGAFKCAKAIVTGGTNIHIGNGTVNGTVYGGGEVGRVEGNSVVAIGIGAGSTPATSAPEIKGDVFGAGKGKKTHGYSALMRGNPTVTIEGDAKVRGSVYGGGEIASVGRYNVKKGQNNPVGAPDDVLVGMPYSLANSGSGYCTVIIQGNAEIGPATEMKMKTTSGIPDDTGHVIGGGKGVLPYDGYGVDDDDWETAPWRVSITDAQDTFNSTTYGTNYEKEYFKYIETLALATETDVTIAGNAFVKGSVYGGSLNGHVQHDTHVTIADDCQIGQGEGVSGRYSTTDWDSESLAECPHWDFDANSGAPYDPYATKLIDGKYYYDVKDSENNYIYAEGGSSEAKDGHTYYGNVFGGGSGVIPYRPGKWHRGAGSVGGDTYVNITGGHILTSVYGGNEHTDVGTYTKDENGQPTTTPVSNGKCTVNITGGTVGVPRTDEEKQAHPVVGNLFGAGKGDQRIFFNTWTNVINTEVNISGDARIFGSVFGGGEDGHVINDAETNIGGTITIGTTDYTHPTEPSTTNPGVIIGTTGTSYNDGNVFGGGRGFSGDAQTAGTVGGNVEVNIMNGQIFGSVYGGGRLASVGTMFEFPTDENGDTNPAYGQFKEDSGGNTYGHVTINISGGTIGRVFTGTLPEGAEHSGNVFGGSMGRLELLDGTRNPIWPKMAQVKETNVNIYGSAVVCRNVYGGGELGTVRDNAYVTIGGQKTADADNDGNVAVTASAGDATHPTTVMRDVYGGGYGSEDRNYTIFTIPELISTNPDTYESHTYAFTPMQFAGCVGKNTYVNVVGGYIRKSVYGGGEMASVGVINYRAAELTSGTSTDGKVYFHDAVSDKDYYYENMVKHGDVDTEFALSWPYEFEYVDGYPGATHVKVTGGRFGLKTGDTDTGFDDNGDVYGAGKGQAGDYKDFVFCANVGSTDVEITHTNNPTAYSGTDDLIAGAVYGGGEDGHVMGDTKVTLKSGLVYHSIYGGGSGKGKFTKTLDKTTNVTQVVTNNTPNPAVTPPTQTETTYEASCYSITAGKVFGNTEVVMTGGTVIRNVYGGGNMGSVGKGNYAGGSDDYSEAGYGEKVSNLWDGNNKFSQAFLSSGKCKVTVSGGTIGYIDTSNPSNSMYPYNSSASLPYGNVFGGCRGESAPNISDSPRYLYSPEFFVGYANETEVTIEGSTTKILGSVYGGGMDGHVRRDAHVIIKGGEIGIPFDATNKSNVQTEDPEDIQWLARGNVYGAGSGIGKYKYDFNYDGDYLDEVDYKMSETRTVRTKEEDFSTSAGSVTRFTKVEVQGGTIHRNVYGGGSLSSIGAPKIGQSYLEYRKGDTAADHGVGKQTLNEIIISGGQIGDANSYDANGNYVYGGRVYGGSRGDASLNTSMFSTSMFTSVSTSNNPIIYGSVFGGGEVGIVKGSVDVTMTGGTVYHDVYGGGALANTNTETSSSVPYTTTVNLTGGLIKGDAYGGGLGRLHKAAVAADPTNNIVAQDEVTAVEAMVYGDVDVTLGNVTENEDDASASAFMTSHYTGGHADVVKSGRIFGCNNLNGSPQGNVTVTVNRTVTGKDDAGADLKRTTATAIESNKTIKENNPDNYESVQGYVIPTYEVAAVYGGGNLAAYAPTATNAKLKVLINSCDVSINEVYGGGNAAAVPETDVEVMGAYEINHVFGGGNGKDDYTLDGGSNWETNPGANIGGNTNTILKGGLIHEAYGGSNEKGDIAGDIVIDTGTGGLTGCPLNLEKMVGAGRNADVNGDLIVIMGCKPSQKVPLLYAGADNANVNGNVELTITSGNFGKVFGGNNEGGAIRGHIIVNIEETGECDTPITIDELYLGGNNAAYSRFGYYIKTNGNYGDTDETPVLTDGRLTFMPRTSADDPHKVVKTYNRADNSWTVYSGTGTDVFTPYAEPVLNVVSCTRIDQVYGGGYGTGGTMYANPTVNINMIQGTFADNDEVGVPAVMTAKGLTASENPNKLGIIGDVFGGGNAAAVMGNPTVNIGMETTVQCHENFDKTARNETHDGYSYSGNQTVLGAYITGNVFGGGNLAEVSGNTYVNICGTQESDSESENGYKDTAVDHSETTDFAVSIGNSVYGGGNAADVLGNTFVTMADGYVFNGIFGGGLAGSVGTYTRDKTVTVFEHDPNHEGTCIGKPIECTAGGTCYVVVSGGQIGPIEVATQGMNRLDANGGPVPQGWVWGGGCGIVEDPANYPDTHFKAYVNNTDVTIKDNAFILESIIGGGEFGRVLGNTLVKIKGGQIGVGANKVDENNKPIRYTADQWTEAEEAVRAGNASRINTIAAQMPECSHFPYGRNIGTEQNPNWVYDTYDPFADEYKTAKNSDLYPGGSTDNASDGKTWIGCVFAGGSGYMPYKKVDANKEITGYDWVRSAGWVEGDAEVRISGGHILSNVYGGNEYTDVKGKCTVKMSGGTVGVPRTLEQIMNAPLIGYIYGAGKGDPRVHFNKVTNVEDVEIEITGGTVFGSVYGGGEDGHVLRNVTMTIENTTVTVPAVEEGQPSTTTTITPHIGTWGTSYVDGNVFGGGRGFSGEAYTAGNVAGSVKMEIKGGNILGSVYGGGRMGSVGYGLFDAGVTGYGEMRKDTDTEEGFNTSFTKGRGHIDITISGGTIGNDLEYIIPKTGSGGNTPNTISETDFTKWNADNWTAWKNHNNIPRTEFDATTGRLMHTKGGNIFAGGMGNLYKQNGTTYISLVDWWKLGCVKSTKLTITGGIIKSNVYGGGELGQVVGNHTVKDAQGNPVYTDANHTVAKVTSTEITIQGSSTTIGTEVKDNSNNTQYTFGSVFGGGYGSLIDDITVNNVTSKPKFIAGLVKEDTKIDMQNGAVKASIYGGGEMASVEGSTDVSISDGTVGIAPITVSATKRYFGGAKMGNVYGGGSGHNNTVRSGQIFKNSNVTISGGTIYHNVYGGGAYGTVGDFNYTEDPNDNYKVVGVESLKTANTGVATVTITGGTIGYDGMENGMVFGSSRGDINAPGKRDDHTAWVYDTHVTIGTSGSNSGPQIRGTVYGSGENGHVFNDTEVTVNSGTIGIYDDKDHTYDITSNNTTYNGADYPYRGNVYGGGCGTDKYYSNPAAETHDGNGQLYNSLAGIVYGNTTVNITGGRVVRNVYGAGAMGSVGKVVSTTTNNVTTTTITSGGLTTINISGGQVGDDGVDDGNVYGAARGDATTDQTDVALAKNTSVNISSNGNIKGSVYGGGETGDVMENTEVNVGAEKQTSGTTVTYVVASGNPIIGGNVYGGGKGIANSFTCSKAMVGVEGDGVTGEGTTASPYELQDGGTTVRIYNGTVGTLNANNTLVEGTGNVYGGGEIARVERNTIVEIGAATGSSAPVIKGSVFGAGAGVETHGYSALVRGTSIVTVQGQAQVKQNVYGGGELASVGRYWVAASQTEADAHYVSIGMPYGLKAGGTSSVIIQGSAIIGTEGNENTGHVYGAGQGVEPENYDYATGTDGVNDYKIDEHKPKRWVGDGYVWFAAKGDYLAYLETLALSAETNVTIGGGTVRGSVFGGSESGFVYRNTDVKIQGGAVNGDAFGGGRGLASFAEAGRVSGNTRLTISSGAVDGNVYGGGNLGDVGTIDKTTQTNYNYIWKNSESNGSNMTSNEYNNAPNNNTITGTNTNTGICTVSISGGTIGLVSTDKPKDHGNVFGAGRGLANTFWCEKAIAFATNVSISGSTTVVNGNVYGGGEVGRVEDDSKVIIGTADGSDEPDIKGSVYGAGAGLETHGYSALVRGNSIVTVQGSSKVGGNVFGGGEKASLGKFKLDDNKLPKEPDGGGSSTVTITDNAKIGSSGTENNVYGAGQGVVPNWVYHEYTSATSYDDRITNSKRMVTYTSSTVHPDATRYKAWDYYEDDDTYVWEYYTTETAYQAYLKTLAIASHPIVTIAENATVYGDVYGGGQRGITLGDVAVNITGGTVKQDVYGGGSLADTNKGNWDDSQYVPVTLPVGHTLTDLYTKDGDTYNPTESDATAVANTTYYSKGTWATGKYVGKATTYKTNVALTGGTIEGNVYGGGLGQIARAASAAQGTEGQEGYVPAVTKLDEVKAKVYGDVLVTLNKPTTSGETTTYGNCVVKENIFGCNNQNGSPQSAVTVHVYKTEGWTGHEGTSSDKLDSEEASDHSYHLNGVYGGGNLSAFYPDLKETRDTVQAFVIIDGCDQTSIKQVYGGGNAASIPATNITINASYEIEEVFGGGNGLNEIIIHGQTMTNPGANVGYEAYPTSYDIPASSKEERTAKFSYGSGKSSVTIYDGLIHRVFGGSNKKGNVRESAVTLLDDQNGCHFQVDEAYGGGKNAPMDAEAKLLMACIPGLKVAYGGAQEADVLGGVTLTITNGTYERVFGGNNISGTIQGPIVVNIEETGCRPIIIGELYGGGNRAAYSVYGYKMVNGELKPRESASDGDAIAGTPYADPVVNVKSFTSIGTIYGGGYGETAVMVGNPTVNIDVFKGQYADDEDNVINENAKVVGSTVKYSGDGYATGFPVPSHAKGAIGAIGTVFGGGNAAKVIGTPTVNIGTRVGEQIDLLSVPVEDSNGKTSSEAGWIPTYQKETVLGADIRGDVYGAGNNAEVTGDTKVQIGKKIETSTTPDPDPTPGP